MNVALKKAWTAESFLAWVVHQEGRYDVLELPEVDIAFPVSALYLGVSISPAR